MKKETKKQIATIFILIIFLGSSLAFALISAFPSENQVNTWRAKLVIIIFGEQQQIPVDIGLTNQTKAKLYTLNSDGIIYKDVSEDANLGDFFQIWGKTFNSTCIFDYCNNANNSMRMYIYTGDKQVENYDYEYYVIQNNDIIVIDYR
jgi:hypothetical protein